MNEEQRERRFRQRQRQREIERQRGSIHSQSISLDPISDPFSVDSAEDEDNPVINEKKKQEKMYNEALDELNSLQGMDSVVTKIKESLSLAKVFKTRENYGLKNEQHALHMIFKGNAGTGKTTIARLVGKLFVGAGLLKKGNFEKTRTDRERSNPFGGMEEKSKGGIPFVECTNADISSAFWGEDEKNMKKKFDESNGGVLFIDEAYSMVSRSGHRSGEKVSAVLVAEMENRRDNVCVIGAGYPNEMNEFIQYNEGLASRFSQVIDFPNYNVETLLTIAEGMAKDRDYVLTEGYRVKLAERLEKERLLRTFGNARTVRNIIEESIRKHAKRIYDEYGASPSREVLINLEEKDISEFKQLYTEEEIHDPYKDLLAQAVANGVVSGDKAKLPKRIKK